MRVRAYTAYTVMQLMEVHTHDVGPAQGHRIVSNRYRVGENGIESIELNADLTITINGECVSFLLFPANVVWAKPLLTPRCSVVSPQTSAAASPPTSSSEVCEPTHSDPG